MLKYAVLILWRKKGVAANFYAFCSEKNGDTSEIASEGERCLKEGFS